MPKSHKIPSKWRAIARQATRLVLEVAPHEQSAAPFKRKGNGNLREELGEERYERVEAIWKTMKNPPQMSECEPWRIGLALGFRPFNRLGFLHEFGCEMQLIEETHAHAHKPLSLEDSSVAPEAFRRTPLNEQCDFIDYTLEKNCEASELARYTAWRKNDPDKFLAALETFLSRFPESNEEVVIARNKAWLPQIIDHVNSPAPFLIAVGSLHMVGPESIPKLLRHKGYTVAHVRDAK